MTVVDATRPALGVPVDRTDELRAPRDGIRLLRLPRRTFVMIDAEGPVGEATIGPRMPGLYTAAYSLHFALKKRGVEERVWPLELLLSTTDGLADFAAGMASDPSTWRWTLMIALSDQATDGELAAAVSAGRTKLPPDLAAGLRVEAFEEGPAAQVMYIGPYSEERPTIERLHAGIAAAGYGPRGRHHEIYMGDPRRAAPEKLRTIIRQPIS